MYLLVNCYSTYIFIYIDYTQLITSDYYVFSFNISGYVNLSDYRVCKIRKCALKMYYKSAIKRRYTDKFI